MKLAIRMIAVMLTMVPLLAAAQMTTAEKIVANVPFEFVLGNKIIPAGQCSVKLNASATGITVLNEKMRVGESLTFVVDEGKRASANYELVFHRYGDRTFLSEIKVADSSIVYRLPESKAEAELQARNAPSTEKALLASRQ
jgi:hypothetical protein